MGEIEFIAQAGQTFSFQPYNSTSGEAIGSPVAAVTDSTTPTLYRVTVDATGIVYGVASATNLKVAGFANLDAPADNGFSPLYGSYAEAASAAVVAERDSLASQVASLTAERDALAADKAELAQQLAELQGTSTNPRHVAPFDFLALFTQLEQVAIFSSSDPTVLLARAQLQTIITYVDLDLPATINFVSYLEQAGLIAAGRAAQVLAGEAPPV
ncbi:MAG: hypothetical protein ACTHK7_01885 [Aureliella sp.]